MVRALPDLYARGLKVLLATKSLYCFSGPCGVSRTLSRPIADVLVHIRPHKAFGNPLVGGAALWMREAMQAVENLPAHRRWENWSGFFH